MDDLFLSSAAKRLRRLIFYDIKNAPLGPSHDAILDFLLTSDTAPGPRNITLEGTLVTELFLAKLFEVNILDIHFLANSLESIQLNTV